MTTPQSLQITGERTVVGSDFECSTEPTPTPYAEPSRSRWATRTSPARAQLSPDGRHLALIHDLAHASIEGDGQTTLQIVDLHSGEIVAGTPRPEPLPGASRGILLVGAAPSHHLDERHCGRRCGRRHLLAEHRRHRPRRRTIRATPHHHRRSPLTPT